MTLHSQLMTMIVMIIGGIYLGFVEETFRRISISWRKNVLLTYLFEVIFWVVQTVLLFYVLYRVNDGELRFYIFLACLLGFSMYIVLFKTVYQYILEWLITAFLMIMKGTYTFILYLIILPVKWISQVVFTTFLFLTKVCFQIVITIFKILFFPIMILGVTLKKLLPEKITKYIFNFTQFCSTILDKVRKGIMAVFWKRR